MKNITGQKFGKLTAIRFIKRENNRTYWQYKCDCGNIVIKRMDGPTNKNTKSCGCLSPEVNKKLNTTHGMTLTKFYQTQQDILQRCLNKKLKIYKNYGGRGIKVCEKWLKFENFKDDMYQSYLEHIKEFGKKDTSIGRIDNNGNYCRENCRWETCKEQSNNTSKNHFLKFNKEIKTVVEWSEYFNISRGTLYGRIKRGWSDKNILTKPINVNCRHKNYIY